jgi:ankyrin repeat protein
MCKEPGQEITFQARRAKFKLFDAVKKDDFAAIPDLLTAGANVYSRNKTGETLLHFAKTGAMVKILLAAGANVHATDKHSNTPLHWAVKNNRIESTQALLLANSCVDAQNTNGDTPLHLAAHWNQIEAARLLLDAGAHTTICNYYEQSPFNRAKTDDMRNLIKTYQPRHWIIEALLAYLPCKRPRLR